MIDTKCEVFFFLVMTFLLIYVVFMGVVVVLEYIFYKRDCKRFDEKYRDR